MKDLKTIKSLLLDALHLIEEHEYLIRENKELKEKLNVFNNDVDRRYAEQQALIGSMFSEMLKDVS